MAALKTGIKSKPLSVFEKLNIINKVAFGMFLEAKLLFSQAFQ